MKTDVFIYVINAMLFAGKEFTIKFDPRGNSKNENTTAGIGSDSGSVFSDAQGGSGDLKVTKLMADDAEVCLCYSILTSCCVLY